MPQEATSIASAAKSAIDKNMAKKAAGQPTDFDRKLKEYSDRIMNLRERRSDINQDIQSVYESAKKDGIDTDALKEVIKRMVKDISDEHKDNVNAYSESLGLGPLFAYVETKH